MNYFYVVISFLLLLFLFKITFSLLRKGGVNRHLLAMAISLPLSIFNLKSFELAYIPWFCIDTSENDFMFYFTGVMWVLYSVPYMSAYRKYHHFK